ncbi:tetratricopeptide repeat protein [Actinomyces sp. HMT897]|nr:tetratricopeptide repeat protein [Actinomyces sp. HMT897]QQO78670.1 tetratricopeptide repeat protein [Actinomyces sp. HMT897]
MGVILDDVDCYERALTTYHDALVLYRKVDGTELQQAHCLNNTGDTLDSIGQHKEALSFYEQALAPVLIGALESDAARFQFPTERDRLTWLTERAVPALALALELASRNDRPDLVSDLIATSRTGGSVDTAALTASGHGVRTGRGEPNVAAGLGPSTPPTNLVPTSLALTAGPPLGTAATPSANLPRRPGPVLHMPHHRTALAGYRPGGPLGAGRSRSWGP